MAKFNTTVKNSTKTVVNYMGEKAFKLDKKSEFLSLILTSFVEDKYYESSSEEITRLRGLIKELDPLFVAKAAIYARKTIGMRSITHALAGELVNYISGKEWASKFYSTIIHRADDMQEILAYYKNNVARNKPKDKADFKLPNAIKKGFRNVFNRLDAYSLSKYRGEGKEFSMIDITRLVHPKPNEKNREALDLLIKGELINDKTWETKLTQAGQLGKNSEEVLALKANAWKELIESDSLGYFAMLRNLRNIVTQAPDLVPEVCKLLVDKDRIRKSLIFPFRFLSAYDEIEKLKTPVTNDSKIVFESEKLSSGLIEMLLKAIESALNTSIDNLPELPGKTLILTDNSGSMTGDLFNSSAVSANSSKTTSAIANLFAVMYWSRCSDTSVGVFGEKLLTPSLDRNKGLFENYNAIVYSAKKVGPGTEAGIYEAFRNLIEEKKIVDRIVVFSDCQIGDGCAWYGTGKDTRGSFDTLLKKYREISPDTIIYSIDLRGYGNTVFDGKVIKLAGWSDKIFDTMQRLESDKLALVKEIEAIAL